MNNTQPTLSVDILVMKDDQVLVGQLAKDWWINDKPTYGFLGREIQFGETFEEAIRRNITEEIGCEMGDHTIISVNANFALGNHFVGIGAVAHISGEPKLLKPEDWETWEWVAAKDMPDNLFPPAANLWQSYTENRVNVAG